MGKTIGDIYNLGKVKRMKQIISCAPNTTYLEKSEIRNHFRKSIARLTAKNSASHRGAQ